MKKLFAIAASLLMAGSAVPAASPQAINPMSRLETEQELGKIVYGVLDAYDRHEYDRLVSYFTEDAHYSSPTRGDLIGHAQIRQAMAKRPPARLTRHCITNLVVTITNADSADAHMIVTAYLNANAFPASGPVAQTAIPAVADYYFKFRRVGNTWLVSEKTTKSVFEGSVNG